MELSQIKHSLVLSLSSQDACARQEATAYLCSLEQEPAFCHSLLALHDQESDPTLRLQLLVLFKTVLGRTWLTKRTKDNSMGSLYSPDQKKALANVLVHFMDTLHQKQQRQTVQQALHWVVRTEGLLPVLHDYIVRRLAECAGYLQNNDTPNLFHPSTTAHLKTIRFLFKEMAKKKAVLAQDKYQSSIQKYWEMLDPLFCFTQSTLCSLAELGSLEGQEQMVGGFIVFSQVVDQLMGNLLTVSYKEQVMGSEQADRTQRLIAKLEVMVQLQNKDQIKPVRQRMQVQVAKVLLLLGQAQSLLPLGMTACLRRYIDMCTLMLINKCLFSEESVIKAAVLCLLKVLKTHQYFIPLVTHFNNPNPSLQRQYELQSQSQGIAKEALSAQVLRNLFLVLVLKVLPQETGELLRREKEEEEDNGKKMIVDHSLDHSLDPGLKESEHPLYKVTLNALDMLTTRFQDEACQIVLEMLQNIHEQDILYQDSILTVLCLMPRILRNRIERQKERVALPMDIGQILVYMNTQMQRLQGDQQMMFSRKMAVVVNKWSDLMQPDLLSQSFQLVLSLLQESPDVVTQYEAVMSLKSLVKRQEVALNIEWPSFMLTVIPLIMRLFSSISLPAILWPLVNFLTVLIEKTQERHSDSPHKRDQLLQVLAQDSHLRVLLSSSNELIRDALADMFCQLVLLFPAETVITPVLNLAFSFLREQLAQALQTSVLKLWYLLVKEYQASQNLDQEIKALLSDFSPLLLQEQEPEHVKYLVMVVEEYVILGYLPISEDLTQLLHKLYLDSAEDWSEEEVGVKVAVNNCLVTVYMLSHREGRVDYAPFMPLLKSILLDLASIGSSVGQVQGHQQITLVGLVTSLLSMFNRFLIDNHVQGLVSAQSILPLEQLLPVWLGLMSRVATKNAMMFNLLALLPLLSHLPCNALLQQQEVLLSVLGQVEKVCVATEPLIVTATANSRLCEYKLSARKEALRKNFMYQHLHLPSLFERHFKEFMQSVAQTGTPLQVFSDQALLQKLMARARLL